MPAQNDNAYNRTAAVAYAEQWAFGRNSRYYNFDPLGGDCTNYASQVLYAGAGVMNYTPVMGWYYISLNNRAPAWTGVEFFYNFITKNTGPGPYGREVGMGEILPGDFCQLRFAGGVYQHTPVIVRVGEPPQPGNILLAAHTNDSLNRPLNTYIYEAVRFIHIDGVRR